MLFTVWAYKQKANRFLAETSIVVPGTVADQGGARAPTLVKTSQKQDGRRTAPQVSRVIGPPLGQISGSATVASDLALGRKNILLCGFVASIYSKSTGRTEPPPH